MRWEKRRPPQVREGDGEGAAAGDPHQWRHQVDRSTSQVQESRLGWKDKLETSWHVDGILMAF